MLRSVHVPTVTYVKVIKTRKILIELFRRVYLAHAFQRDIYKHAEKPPVTVTYIGGVYLPQP